MCPGSLHLQIFDLDTQMVKAGIVAADDSGGLGAILDLPKIGDAGFQKPLGFTQKLADQVAPGWTYCCSL